MQLQIPTTLSVSCLKRWVPFGRGYLNIQSPKPNAHGTQVSMVQTQCPSLRAMLISQPQMVHLHAVLNVEVNLNIDGEDYKVIALVDTGAEVNLIKKGLIPERHLRTPPSPITIITADSSNMAGGNQGVMGLATFQGVETDLKIPIDVQCPIHLYEANITYQAILSYEWMATHDFMVVPRRHALHYRDANSDIVIQGIGIQTKRLSRLRKEGVKTFVLPTSQAKAITDTPPSETPPTSEITEPTTMPTS